MFIKQVSVFLENKEGSLAQATEILAKASIHILCISLADTNDFGLIRMITSDPDKAVEILKESGLSARITPVLGVKLPHSFGMLHKLTQALSESGINVEYMYALTSGHENASILIKTSDMEKSEIVIDNSEFELVTPEEAYNL